VKEVSLGTKPSTGQGGLKGKKGWGQKKIQGRGEDTCFTGQGSCTEEKQKKLGEQKEKRKRGLFTPRNY